MVKTLEKIIGRKKICLNKIKNYSIKEIFNSNFKASYRNADMKAYFCDCDQWGGGDPPCYNDKC